MAKHKKPRKKPQKKSSNADKLIHITAILSLINGLIMLANSIISLIKTLIQ